MRILSFPVLAGAYSVGAVCGVALIINHARNAPMPPVPHNAADMACLLQGFQAANIALKTQSFVLRGARATGETLTGANVVAVHNSEDDVLTITGLTGTSRATLKDAIAACRPEEPSAPQIASDNIAPV